MKISLLFCCSLILASFPAHAQNCAMLPFNVEDAQTKFERAWRETDFELAKTDARFAEIAIDAAAMSSHDCQCPGAQAAFKTTLSHTKKAGDARTSMEFNDAFSNAKQSFSSAFDELRKCASE